jgi:signal peptidase I
VPEVASLALAAGSSWRRPAARIWWQVVAPLSCTALAMRTLVPGRSEIGPGPWGSLARLGDQHPLLLAIGFFALFTLLVRQFRDLLPAGHHLVGSANTDVTRDVTGNLLSLVATVLCAALAALSLRITVGQPYRVTSGSMLPTLAPSDDVLVNKLAFGIRLPGRRQPLSPRLPGRGDIAVFRATAVGEHGEEPMLVKRVIGLPGDRITMQGGLVSINGWRVPTCDAGKYVYFNGERTVSGRLLVEFLDDRAYLTVHTPEARGFAGYVVAPGEVFVLGDNRNGSRDSRSWNDGRGGGVPLRAFEGRAARVVGWDRDGHLDWGRLLTRPDLKVQLPGMNTEPIRARVQQCLAKRPPVTSPPASSQ